MDEDEDYSYDEKPRLRLASGPATKRGTESRGGEHRPARPFHAPWSCPDRPGRGHLRYSAVFAFWFALEFLVGPFSPVTHYWRRLRVGVGEPLDFSQGGGGSPGRCCTDHQGLLCFQRLRCFQASACPNHQRPQQPSSQRQGHHVQCQGHSPGGRSKRWVWLCRVGSTEEAPGEVPSVGRRSAGRLYPGDSAPRDRRKRSRQSPNSWPSAQTRTPSLHSRHRQQQQQQQQ